MPRGDGTGPTGQGRGAGRGMGRGQGQRSNGWAICCRAWWQLCMSQLRAASSPYRRTTV